MPSLHLKIKQHFGEMGVETLRICATKAHRRCENQPEPAGLEIKLICKHFITNNLHKNLSFSAFAETVD
jgi:hypothetical protein